MITLCFNHGGGLISRVSNLGLRCLAFSTATRISSCKLQQWNILQVGQ